MPRFFKSWVAQTLSFSFSLSFFCVMWEMLRSRIRRERECLDDIFFVCGNGSTKLFWEGNKGCTGITLRNAAFYYGFRDFPRIKYCAIAIVHFFSWTVRKSSRRALYSSWIAKHFHISSSVLQSKLKLSSFLSCAFWLVQKHDSSSLWKCQIPSCILTSENPRRKSPPLFDPHLFLSLSFFHSLSRSPLSLSHPKDRDNCDGIALARRKLMGREEWGRRRRSENRAAAAEAIVAAAAAGLNGPRVFVARPTHKVLDGYDIMSTSVQENVELQEGIFLRPEITGWHEKTVEVSLTFVYE